MSTSAALSLYRELVVAHAGVPQAFIEAEITQAAADLTASAWGSRITAAIVYLAAHRVETNPKVPGLCSDTAGAPGPLVHKSDSEGEGAERKSKTRSYAAPASSGSADEDDLRRTNWGQRFLALRRSRAASGPRVVRTGC